MFIQTVTREAFKKANSKESELSYENLANLVSKDERFQFLSGKIILKSTFFIKNFKKKS